MSAIAIVAKIVVKPESYDAAIALFNELVPASRAEKGNIQYDLHQDTQDKNCFVVIENWASQAAIDEHNATPHFKKLVEFAPANTTTLDVQLLNKIM